jgi:tetratricopeptide (TPR) repeat protein
VVRPAEHRGAFFRVRQEPAASQTAVMTVAPGQDAGPEEEHAGDQIVYVLEGEADVRVGAERFVQRGIATCCASEAIQSHPLGARRRRGHSVAVTKAMTPESNLDIGEFHRQVMHDLREGRAEEAIERTRDMIRQAESAADGERALLLYSVLLDIYAFTGDSDKAHEVRQEREAKYPRNLEIRLAEVERLFWIERQYALVIRRAAELLNQVATDPLLYERCQHLKGLAHLELGNLTEAAEVLKVSRYYDTTLVERLIEHGVVPDECRRFLLRALEKHREWRNQGKSVEASLLKIEELLARVGR